jgi:hypothetical protein
MSGNRQQERFRVDCREIIRETDRAVLVYVDYEKYGLARGGNCEMWFPLSQVHEIHQAGLESGPYIVVTPWIAKQKGLE